MGRYRRRGISIHPFYPGWESETLDSIEQTLRKKATGHTFDHGRRPVGIGYSAGGVLLVANHELFEKIVIINSHVQDTDSHPSANYRAQKYPAYGALLAGLSKNLQAIPEDRLQHDFLAYQSLVDCVVSPYDAVMLGVPDEHNRRMMNYGPLPAIGHSPSIAMTLIFEADHIAAFANS